MARRTTRLRLRPRLLAALALACAGLPAAGSASALADCPGSAAQVAEQSGPELERSVLCLINERRAAAGVATVRPNGQLERAARRHSEDMVDRGFFSHTSPGGADFIDRITASGYLRGARSWLVGENLAWGTMDLSTPASLVRAWMESPPHRANLLRERFREIGIAAASGTPDEAADPDGVTISTEYGRAVRKAKGGWKARKARRAHRSRRSA